MRVDDAVGGQQPHADDRHRDHRGEHVEHRADGREPVRHRVDADDRRPEDQRRPQIERVLARVHDRRPQGRDRRRPGRGCRSSPRRRATTPPADGRAPRHAAVQHARQRPPAIAPEHREGERMGAPATISGAATKMISRCWTMCTVRAAVGGRVERRQQRDDQHRDAAAQDGEPASAHRRSPARRRCARASRIQPPRPKRQDARADEDQAQPEIEPDEDVMIPSGHADGRDATDRGPLGRPTASPSAPAAQRSRRSRESAARRRRAAPAAACTASRPRVRPR